VSAHPARSRRRDPRLFSNRMTGIAALLLFLLLILGPLALATTNGFLAILPLPGYLLLVMVTWAVVAGVRREPGSWLGRRGVRRVVVAAVAADCVGLIATSLPNPQLGSATLLLLIFLVLLNIALGNATQRMATAPEGRIDERQEELRNRAHRLAYPVFAGVVGALLLADVASRPSREWAEHALGSGGFFVFLELLFVLPGMVLAFIEPAPPPPDPDAAPLPRRVNVQARVAVALVVLVFAIPVLASIGLLVLPVRASPLSFVTTPAPVLSGSPASPSSGGQQSAAPICGDPLTTVTVGWGVSAEMPVSVSACWDGQRAFEPAGASYFGGECWENQAFVTVAATQCGPTITAGPGGSLTFTWRGTLSPTLLPFLSRHVTVQVIIDRNGHAEVVT